jgi:transcriptional regulator with XRE-family HTH domain
MDRKTTTPSSETHAFWRLKRLREVKGVTLEDLAQQTGLTKSFLSKVERGVSMPSIATVLKIADAFKVSAGNLFSFHRIQRGSCGCSQERAQAIHWPAL